MDNSKNYDKIKVLSSILDNLNDEEKEMFFAVIGKQVTDNVGDKIKDIVEDIMKKYMQDMMIDENMAAFIKLPNKPMIVKEDEANYDEIDNKVSDEIAISNNPKQLQFVSLDGKVGVANNDVPISKRKKNAPVFFGGNVATIGAVAGVSLASAMLPGVGAITGITTAIGLLTKALKNTEEKRLSQEEKVRLAQVYEELKYEGKVGRYDWYAGYGGDEDSIGFEPFDAIANYRVENCLKDIIKNKGLMMSKIAELVGIDRSTLSEIVNEKSTPNILVVLKICSLLSITVDQAFRLVDANIEIANQEK